MSDMGRDKDAPESILGIGTGIGSISACFCDGACRKTGKCPRNTTIGALGVIGDELVPRNVAVVGTKLAYFDNPPLMADALCAQDIREARLDRDAFGRVHQEIKFAVAMQVLRSIATEQIGANSAVKALAQAAIEVCE